MKQAKRLFLSTLLFLFCASFSFAQDVKVTGKIVDKNNEPMIGVSIMVKGTSHGTVSNLDGGYSLSVVPGSTIVYSYIGYIPESRVIKQSGTVNVTLNEDNKSLNEVVVIGYGVQKKRDVTGAISSIKAQDVENRSITNAQQALQGKTSGVEVIQTSASPTASPTVRVRGFSSNVSSNPLFVVNGVRMSSIAGIDPNDIESIDVLKDAASAAIYGAEAGNGVVLVTTKKGKVGKGKINYDFQLASQSLAKKPDLLNAEEYINYMTEGGILSKDAINSSYDGTTDTDWLDATFGTGKMQKHNISFTGGSMDGNYYLSLGYLDNNGIVKGDADTYKRLSATINGEWNIKPWLKVGTTTQLEKYNSRAISENTEYGGLMAASLMMDPLTAVTYTADNLPSNMVNAQSQGRTLLQDGNGNYYGVSQFFASEQYNPFIMRDNNITRSSGYNMTGSIYADFKPIDCFTFTSRLGYILSGTRYSSTSLPFYGNSTQNRDYVSLSSQSSTSIYYQWENFANFNKKFGQHTVNAMVGMSYQESTYDYTLGSLSANEEDAVLKNNPLFYFLNYASASSTKGVGGEKTRTAQMSYFGRVSYDFAGKYLLQASLRADAADLSKLSKNQRWGYFPAVSAGWTMSEEKFFEPLKNVISSWKWRASWGQNGSLSALGSYSYGTDMATGGLYPLVTGNVYTTAVSPTSLGNDNLKWETSEQFDFGFDSRFFNDRLTFSMDYYVKKTKDLLVWNTTPSLIIGGTTSPINAGNVRNKGFEFELGWRDHVGELSYGIKGNLATLKNEVTYLDPSLTRIGGTTFHTSTLTYFEQGYPIYYFRGYKFTGVDATTGDPTFADLDNSGTLNDGDLTNIGDAIPDFTYGLTLTAAYKGFDLTVFATGSQGNDIWNCINRYDYPASNKLKKLFYTDRWTETNTTGKSPRANANNMDKYQLSDALVCDGSYFKIIAVR
jgi:TonB-linked SusC/RagA family outer membrane protein